ncbi:DAK2 domain-containing protein [Streptomyces sp. 71268]|uniref:DAK2 domain-containing protein n=1 Tax=Streptomyces sp. 71268 TaxID=3002640 RepID=UPI0023F764D2|nr:DAK2 domain-containing protein [Streptomyces sp. 71268]WEV25117.1 DAK2 domain-containing protein [Streptomyces sp. 71268]
MPHTFDAEAVRTWCGLALEALGRAREGIDAINVYPVADGDTGTNLYLTVESAAQAVGAAFNGHAATGTASRPSLGDAIGAMAHGALIGAHGNSGTILAQMLRGMADVFAEQYEADDATDDARGEGDARHASGVVLSRALLRAADSARNAVARPVEGTVLTVAASAAAAAARAAGARPAEHGASAPYGAETGHGAATGHGARTGHGAEAGHGAVTGHGAEQGAVYGAATASEGGAAPGTRSTPATRWAAVPVGAVARAAYEGACAALDATTGQLDVLARAGVVDAGGYGLVTVLGALAETLTGERTTAPTGPLRAALGSHGLGPGSSDPEPHEPRRPAAPPAPLTPTERSADVDAPYGAATPERAPAGAGPSGRPTGCDGEPITGPAYEVIYLLEADDTAVARLRGRLDALGDSLVIVGGDGLWNVHVHVDDAGAAVEAGIQAGRPYRLRITHFGAAAERRLHRETAPREPQRTDGARGTVHGARGERAARSVVLVVPGDGLAALCGEAGATVVTARPGEPPASGELVDAIRRAHAHEVVLLPNDAELRHTAAAAAAQMRTEGVRVALIPTRSVVQGIAALAVHEGDRGFDEDVVAMTSAAGATRYAELAVAERQSWTMAGVCQAGDVLGLIDGDVVVIGADLLATARTVLDRMLAAGGEMVTLVLGAGVPNNLAERLEEHVRERHLAVDTVSYRGEQPSAPLLIGIE